jgi:hypothetical protein
MGCSERTQSLSIYVGVILLVLCCIVLVMANCLVDYAMFHVLLSLEKVVLCPGIFSMTLF